jgi:hypothetical protein
MGPFEVKTSSCRTDMSRTFVRTVCESSLKSPESTYYTAILTGSRNRNEEIGYPYEVDGIWTDLEQNWIRNPMSFGRFQEPGTSETELSEQRLE